jgi:hypothetical protein
MYTKGTRTFVLVTVAIPSHNFVVDVRAEDLKLLGCHILHYLSHRLVIYQLD